jgi:hypothetical protein
MDDYRLHIRADHWRGGEVWFWRLDDAAGFQLAADAADTLDGVLDAVKRSVADLGLSPRPGGPAPSSP